MPVIVTVSARNLNYRIGQKPYRLVKRRCRKRLAEQQGNNNAFCYMSADRNVSLQANLF
jgi:hypothetical protein